MMMRQFMRVKQIADNKFQRSEKGGGGGGASEALTEELSAAEKRVELIRQSCAASGKKLSSCTHRLTPETADKKTSRKVPEAVLAQCMEEWGLHLGETSILGMTLVDCARIQEALAYNLLAYKAQVEDTVVEPLQNILKIDVANILKYRKQLTKLMSEMNSAKMRYQNAAKNCQQQQGTCTPAALAKADLLKEEAEDAVTRADQCRDSLAAEMFNLISREPEMSHHFVRLCRLQLEYHKRSLSSLEAALPELETQIRSCPYHPVFGFPLEEHLEVTKREIAVVLETCVCWLLDSAMDEEGLFRIGGSLTKIKKMKSAFDAGFWQLIDEERDPHNISGVLKLYLRSLPEPLLTYALYDDWINAASIQDHDMRLQSLWTVVNSLPEPNLKNLRYLIKFLSKLSQNSDINKMSSQNVAIVIGPNLLWPEVEDSVLGMNMTATNLYSSIVDSLISYSDWFFPGECDFHMSTPTTPRHIEGFPVAPPSLSGSQLSLSTARLSNGDSALDSSLSSSPTNSSPKSPSPRVPLRPRKKAAPVAPEVNFRNQITRSLSCGVFQPKALSAASLASSVSSNSSRLTLHSMSHEDLLSSTGYRSNGSVHGNGSQEDPAPISTASVRLRSVSQASRPPRRRKGLPPVAERTLRPLERPSVPPPERPDSLLMKPDNPRSSRPEMTDVLELDDVSLSLDSSGSSDTYNDCTMTMVDDSDSDERRDTTESEPSPQLMESSHQLMESSHQLMKSSYQLMESNHRLRYVGEEIETMTETKESTHASNESHKTESSQTMHAVQDSRKGESSHSTHVGLESHMTESSQSTNKQSETRGMASSSSMHRLDVQRMNPSSQSTHAVSRSTGSSPTHMLGEPLARGLSQSTHALGVSLPGLSQATHALNRVQKDSSSSSTLDETARACSSMCSSNALAGGTPTWFEHYDQKRPEADDGSVWFGDDEAFDELADVFVEGSRSTEDTRFRTVIEVDTGADFVPSTTRVTGTAIKLRVNSQTQNTRL